LNIIRLGYQIINCCFLFNSETRFIFMHIFLSITL